MKFSWPNLEMIKLWASTHLGWGPSIKDEIFGQ